MRNEHGAIRPRKSVIYPLAQGDKPENAAGQEKYVSMGSFDGIVVMRIMDKLRYSFFLRWFYPVGSATDEYVSGAPLFKKVT
jgi:hypothetical protein